MNIDPTALTRLLPVGETIVEERVWLRGTEVVSHVNFTQLERVRSSRGMTFGEFEDSQLVLPVRHAQPEPEAPAARVA